MDPSDQTDPLPNNEEPARRAIAELRQAIADKRVEPICAAYQALRDALVPGEDGDVLHLIDPKIAEKIKPYIISAFSHRKCFMCEHGVISCQQCETTGNLLDGRVCPICKGYGQAACGFCRGTGWAVREMLPPELNEAVLQKQVAHLHEELGSLSTTIGTGDSEELRKLPPEQKRTVAAWLIRIYARLTDLLQSDAVRDEKEQERLGTIASRIRKCFFMMR